MSIFERVHELSRSPRGERGLTFEQVILEGVGVGSLPSRGAWIEIQVLPTPTAPAGSLPSRGAWIEIVSVGVAYGTGQSRSPRGGRGVK